MDTAQLYEFDVNGAYRPSYDPGRAYKQPSLPSSLLLDELSGCSHAPFLFPRPGFIVIKNMVDPGTVDEMNALLDADTAAQLPGYAARTREW